MARSGHFVEDKPRKALAVRRVVGASATRSQCVGNASAKHRRRVGAASERDVLHWVDGEVRKRC
jgi:hypothetical protein